MAISAGPLEAHLAPHSLPAPDSLPALLGQRAFGVGAASGEESGQKATASRPGKIPGKSCQVLLVEDDAAVAELYATVLRLHGHNVTVAIDGLAGLEAIRSGPFDIILLDLRMPRMDGLGMLRTMIEERVGTDTPVVVLTNYDDSILQQEALDLGARDYLLKSRTMPQDLALQLTRWCA